METSLSGDSLSLGLIIYATVVVFLAGAVRGYTGFGFSALVLLSLSLFIPPVVVVPVLLLLEVVASIHLLPSVWRHIDRRTLGWLMLGTIFSVPLGVYVLASLPAAEMRIIISLLVLTTTILLWRGYRFPGGGSQKLSFVTGLISGAMTGAAGVGGLIVVVMFLSVSAPVAVVRATMVAFLMLKDIYTLGIAGAYSLLNTDVFLAAIMLVLPLFAGVTVGRHLFNVTSPAVFQRFVLAILSTLSIAGIARALIG
ncbi:putative membrane protein YfcA [Natronocella acetinitrilica]|uniref:Probable membrane transporter protein n=1 Tax=Natronocella acetinitrilica TaxID=414046 RepID=A0AAE3KI30_9GAMM|nr:sulfite exporter TauE/SafE family protein [Natronocella acetinitrilica]MCP1676957.1 putative membrane protein YfcA [Natronocella acetinitrilica]